MRFEEINPIAKIDRGSTVLTVEDKGHYFVLRRWSVNRWGNKEAQPSFSIFRNELKEFLAILIDN